MPAREARDSRPLEGLRDGCRGRGEVAAVVEERREGGLRGAGVVLICGDLAVGGGWPARESWLSDWVRPVSSSLVVMPVPVDCRRGGAVCCGCAIEMSAS